MMERRTIALPITDVTVLEDRAVVTRRGRVSLDGSPLRIEDVSPTTVDKTLSVRAEGARVLQARIRRQPATALVSQDEQVRLQLEQLERLEDAVADARGQLSVAQETVASLALVEGLQLTELADDIALGRDIGPRMAQLDAVRTRIEQALEHQIVGLREVSRAEEAERTARRSLETTDTPPRSCRADIEMQLHGEGEVELILRYSVAGALWRPAHVASLLADGRVQVEAQAYVWQATGEDWTDARLSFSTERPSLGTTPPRLHTDTLHLQGKSRAVEVEAREQVIATTGEGAAAVRDELPGVDDGGEPLALQSAEPRTVLANGRPHRVPLFAFESEAQRELLCRAEKAEAVLLRTLQDHRGEHPLLAGPVELRRNGGYVGRTSVSFVAPGERFELGWGPEPDLRVHRKEKHGEHTRKPLSSWVRKPRTIELTVSNLGPEPYDVRVQERIVVSEVEKVEVERGSLGGATVDDDGIVSKEVRVRGFGETTFSFDWTLVVHDDVQGL